MPFRYETSNPDDLASEALRKFGMDRTCTARLLQISENTTYLVENRNDPVQKAVLRINRPGYHTVGELLDEIEWQKAIKADTPLIVPDAIPGKDGSYVQELNGETGGPVFTCVMYEFLTGNPPDEKDGDNAVRHFRQLGEATAYLHRQVRSWNKSNHLNRFTWDTEAMIGQNGRWGRWQAAADLTPEIRRTLETVGRIIRKRLTAYGRGRNRFGLIHADLRLANLLVENGRMKIIDFDDCGYGWFMHDLAAAVSFIETKPVTKNLIAAWIEGYSGVGRLTDGDLSEIDTFIMQRRLQLMAWLASHSDSHPVRKLRAGFTEGTAALAEQYLQKFA